MSWGRAAIHTSPIFRGESAGLSPIQTQSAIATGGLTAQNDINEAGAKRDAHYRQQQAIIARMQADNDYQQQQTRMAELRAAQEGVRSQALSSVNQAYASPSRERGIQATYDARLRDSLAGINTNYQYGAQQSGLADASRGRLGSSTDAEHQAALRNSLQMSTRSATADAQGVADDMRSNDYNQHLALTNAIQAGDPQTAAQYQQMVAQSNQQAGQMTQRAAFVDQNRYLGQQYGNVQSQQLGGYINSATNGVNSYYGGQGYGNAQSYYKNRG